MAPDDCRKTMTATEPAFYEYTAWAFDHQRELLHALDEAGADAALLRFIQTVERGTRHSVLMTLFRHHAHADASVDEAAVPNAENCQDAHKFGGGFFEKLWDGHVADAYCHADRNNRPMMEETFDKQEIIEAGLQNDGPFCDRDYLSNLISEKWDR